MVELNTELRDNPELVNDDPYGDGWMIKMKITDSSQLDNLLSASDYADITA